MLRLGRTGLKVKIHTNPKTKIIKNKSKRVLACRRGNQTFQKRICIRKAKKNRATLQNNNIIIGRLRFLDIGAFCGFIYGVQGLPSFALKVGFLCLAHENINPLGVYSILLPRPKMTEC
jgi:hypothetical protein